MGRPRTAVPPHRTRKAPPDVAQPGASAPETGSAQPSAHAAGNQAAQRALAPAADIGPQLATTPERVPNLQEDETLELYQGAEFPQLAGRLSYKRKVTIITPHGNYARLEIDGSASFPPGTPLPLPKPGPPYPSDYHHLQPGDPKQLEIAAPSDYRWIVDVEYADPYLRKWLPVPYHPEGGDRQIKATASVADTAGSAPSFAALRITPWAQYKTLADFVDRSEDAARAEARRIQGEAEELDVEPPAPPGAEQAQETVRDKPASKSGLAEKIFRFLARLLRGIASLWNALPWYVRGILKWAAGIALTVAVVYLAAYLIVGALAEFGIVVAVGTVAKVIGGLLLSYMFVRSVIGLIREGANPFAIPGIAILETIGVRGMIESFTDRSMVSGTPYHRSKEERLEAFLYGGTQFLATALGARSLLRRGTPATVDDPNPPATVDTQPPAPAPAAPSTPPGQYTPRTAPQIVGAADLDRPPADVVESRGAHPPPQGATHADPFSGRSYRDSDVMSRARTARSLRTGIDAARAERLAYEDGKARHYIGLREPGHANAPGPDCLWARRNPDTGLMEIVFGDATVNTSKTPYRTPPATWVAEAGQAVQPGVLDLGNPALEAEIRAAYAAGRFVMETTLVELLPNGVRFTPL